VILLQLKLTKLKLEVPSLTFSTKKDMNTDKFTTNWQNFARVWLQLRFAFIIRPKYFTKDNFYYRYYTQYALEKLATAEGIEHPNLSGRVQNLTAKLFANAQKFQDILISQSRSTLYQGLAFSCSEVSFW